ncbi:ATP-binding protein [Streptomyces endophytica]|uniref:Tetratricopeptide repeat protein n=1 Tax=Streptomyces endophytica TaxID=2991496 RepID=A0ABY6PH06_9ACTN|nr:tetratricopeptide repeat protein [Streptomyces endophytica]UZJ33163.1 tetratricopeptide repeat protein [Streptomyces endophytica]
MAASGTPGAPGGVHNAVSGGVFHGPVIQGGQVTVTLAQQPVGTPSSALPSPSSVHVGHEAELASLKAALDTGDGSAGPAVCLVTGPGGVGKSELLIQAAHAARRQRQFPGGLLYVDLRGHDAGSPPLTPGEALGRLLHQLGVPEAAVPVHAEDRAALYRRHLAEQTVLVVLDNAHDSEQVHPMLPPPGASRVLVSSRRQLPAVDEAHRMTLDVLPHDAAVRLLLEVSARPGAATAGPAGEELARPAARIAERCGGLPLALRIAAARVRGRPPAAFADLAGWLADEQSRLDELDDGERRMTSVLAVSYRDLDDEQRRLFALCGVHPGPRLGLHAAAALVDLPLARVRRLLEGLCAAHMVQEEERGRYRLHGLVHDYARERAEEDLPAAVRRAAVDRLVDHYLATADRADRVLSPHRYRLQDEHGLPPGTAPEISSRTEALSWLAAELDNLVGICRAAADSSAPARSWLLADALRGYFFLAKTWTPWQATHEVALTAAERAGAHREQGILHNSLGLALLEQRDLPGASAHYTAAAGHFETAGDAHGSANAVENHAWVRHYSGDFAGALDDHLRALRQYERLAAERNRAITLRGMSLAELELGRTTDAIGHLQEAGRIFAERDMHLDAAMTLNGLGEAYAKAGDPTSARRHLLRALRLSRSCGSRYEEARARRGLGSVCRAGAPRLALHHWERALHHYTELGSPEAEAVRALIAEVRA